MTYESKHISVPVNRPWNEAYDFAVNPENLPKWASGLSKSTLKKSGEDWMADSPMGQVKVRFAEKNKFGVLDHDVTLPNETVAHNPMRILKNNNGCDILFTVYRLPGTSEQDFKKDADHVHKDLMQLKTILEK